MKIIKLFFIKTNKKGVLFSLFFNYLLDLVVKMKTLKGGDLGGERKRVFIKLQSRKMLFLEFIFSAVISLFIVLFSNFQIDTFSN